VQEDFPLAQITELGKVSSCGLRVSSRSIPGAVRVGVDHKKAMRNYSADLYAVLGPCSRTFPSKKGMYVLYVQYIHTHTHTYISGIPVGPSDRKRPPWQRHTKFRRKT
jgi:hypothetical protein